MITTLVVFLLVIVFLAFFIGKNLSNVCMDKTKNGWRLPTEAEWEYIAANKNTSDTLYPGTNDLGTNGTYGWITTSNTATDKPRPCGKCPNGVNGIMDLAGNVFEMCWDWYTTIDTGTLENGGDIGDAVSKDGIKCKVVRGGCFTYGATAATVIRPIQNATSGSPVYNRITDRWWNCGARLVRTKVTP